MRTDVREGLFHAPGVASKRLDFEIRALGVNAYTCSDRGAVHTVNFRCCRKRRRDLNISFVEAPDTFGIRQRRH